MHGGNGDLLGLALALALELALELSVVDTWVGR